MAPVADADDGEANRLFVAAASAMKEADRLPIDLADERAGLYEDAFRKLQEIVAAHPESDLAVKLIASEAVGDITMSGIERRALLAEAATCLAQLDSACLLGKSDPFVRAIADPAEIDWIQLKRTWLLAKLDNFSKARQVIESIAAGVLKATALSYMAGWRAAFGDREIAEQLLAEADANLREAPSGAALVGAWSEMAWAYARLGEIERAHQLWRKADAGWSALESKLEQLETKREIASDKLDAGALEALEADIAWLDGRLTDDGAIAEYHARTLDVRDMIEQSFLAARAKVYVAQLYAEADRGADATRSLSAVEDLLKRSDHLHTDTWLLAQLAGAQAHQGRFSDALGTAESISATDHHARALLGIAKAQIDAKQRDAARRTLFDAFNVAEDGGSLDEALSFVMDAAGNVN